MLEWLSKIRVSYPLIDERAEPHAFEKPAPPAAPSPVPTAAAEPSQMSAFGSYDAPHQRWDNGDKWTGGFGNTQLLTADYWTLRARSKQLFETNLYARGLVRRLVTNVINTGLHLECTPVEKLLGKAEQSLAPWAEDVETRFDLYGSEPWLCHQGEECTFGALQQEAHQEALISGDVLVTLRQYPLTGLPRIHLISGSVIQTPFPSPKLREGYRLEHGVELDPFRRQVAYWVLQADGTSKRYPAYGEKSGRRLAWLYYGSDKQMGDVRGKPLLSLVLQSLKEIDRYRDSVQRKAVINSMLAMFIQKLEAKPGTLPMTAGGGALRKGEAVAQAGDGTTRSFAAAEQIPGLVFQELQHGEIPVAFPSHGTDEKFGDFESALLSGVAWTFGIPPEILKLSFSSNYSASQAAINEFKMVLNQWRTHTGNTLCKPIYVEWLIASAITEKIEAPGLLAAWRDPLKHDLYCAWMTCDWSGQIKPAVDMSKLIKGYREAVYEGFLTRDRATRELTGTKYSQNVKKLRLENEQLLEANKPLKELEEKGAPPAAEPVAEPPEKSLDDEDEDEQVNDDDLEGASVIPIRAER